MESRETPKRKGRGRRAKKSNFNFMKPQKLDFSSCDSTAESVINVESSSKTCSNNTYLENDIVTSELTMNSEPLNDIEELYLRMSANELTDVLDSCTTCLLYTSPSPRDYAASRMPSSA